MAGRVTSLQDAQAAHLAQLRKITVDSRAGPSPIDRLAPLHARAQLGTVTEPFKGAPHTVEHIKRCALGAQRYYPLRLLAEDIVGRLDSKDYLSEIMAVYYWVCGHTRYANDPRTIELVRSPAPPGGHAR